jgi:hypothetical protein
MPLDHDKLKKTKEGARAGLGWKTKPGDNKVRILPPHSRYIDNLEEVENLAVPYKMHFFRIEGRPGEATRCLGELRQSCPACRMWGAYRQSDDPGLKQMASQISPGDQYLFNMLDLNNLQAGIQKWAANWTCWDKIMAIACNPAWGDVIDPANGVDFTVKMIPKGESRSGYNAYDVMPEPQRTSVMEVLAGVEDWQKQLDELESLIPEAKAVEEIISLLDEMGFPSLARGPTAASAAAPAPIVAAPAPAAAAPASVTTSSPTPVTAAPVTAAPQPVVAPVEVSSSAPPIGAPPAAPHFDPGPDYSPKVSDAERPVGAPRCFGDYGPDVRRMDNGSSACAVCPQLSPCQEHLLGIE